MSGLTRGQIVTIRKGAKVHSLCESKGDYVLSREQKVKIHLVLDAFWSNGYLRDAEISWAGTGGYWCYAKQADIKS